MLNDGGANKGANDGFLIVQLTDSCFLLLLFLAEAQLSGLTKTPGYPLQLLEIVASNNNAPPPVRQASAVQFKNLVKHGWDETKEVRKFPSRFCVAHI